MTVTIFGAGSVMRMAIFGGTFDPIHYGHLVLAEQCREQCQLDEVWFVPAAIPPHKQTAVISSPQVRCEMIEFAIAGNPAFRLSKIELERKGPSFTVETLAQLHAEDSSRELMILIGADSLRDLHLWREPDRILQLATIVAVNRGNRVLPDLDNLRAVCGEQTESRVKSVEMTSLAISSTDIRSRVNQGQSIRYLVPRAVEAYIHEQGLYR